MNFASTEDDFASQLPTAERFEIRRPIGKGSSSVVYEAFDHERDEVVALKTIPHDQGIESWRLKKEFRTDIIHPNLVTLYDLFATGSHCFFTMELIDGCDFLEYARGRREEASSNADVPACSQACGRDDDRLRDAIRQLASGLNALHDAGLVHRDVKPSNVMVTKDGRVVLLDFGLSARFRWREYTSTSSHHLAGALEYMAPELGPDTEPAPPADWFGVGVMLYQSLTGRTPYPADLLEKLMAKQVGDFLPPCELAENVPDDLNQLCVELLSPLPHNRPAGAEVQRRMGSATATRPKSQPEHPTAFVGRDGQFAQLDQAFSALCHGRSPRVLIQGTSGLGKTELAHRFLSGLKERDDVVVLTGRCYSRESIAYKTLDDVVTSLVRYLRKLPPLEAEVLLPFDVAALTRLFPDFGRVEAIAAIAAQSAQIPDHQELRRRGTAALRELLSRLGRRRRLIVFIDDLQWGDADGAALLAELFRGVQPPQMLLVGSYRSEDVDNSRCLQVLLEASAAEHEQPTFDVRVSELSPADSEQLIGELLQQAGQPPDELARVIASESEGNPFFMREFVEYTSDTQHGIAPSRLRLNEVLWSRVSELPGETQTLLEVIAIAARPIHRQDAAAAAGLSRGDGPLSLLVQRRLARDAGAGLIEPYHDRIRETVAAHLPGGRTSEHHHRLAQVLVASGRAGPEQLAVHFLNANDRNRAGAYYQKAADNAAAALAFDRATTLYRTAIELRVTDDAGLLALQIQLAEALANAGRGLDAAKQYISAAAAAERSGNSAQSFDLKRHAATQLLVSGHIEEAMKHLGDVVRTFGMKMPHSPGEALRRMLVRRALTRLRGSRFRERGADEVPLTVASKIDLYWAATAGFGCIYPIYGTFFQSHHLSLSLNAGDPRHVARALAAEAAHRAYTGNHGRRIGERLLQMAWRLAKEQDDPYTTGVTTLMAGICECLADRWHAGPELLDKAEQTFRENCTGVVWELDTCHIFTLFALKYLGRLRDLEARRRAVVTEAIDRGDVYLTVYATTQIMTVPMLAAGRTDEAQAELDATRGRLHQDGFHVHHLVALIAQNQIDLYRGQAGDTWSHMVETWPNVKESQIVRIQWKRMYYWFHRGVCALSGSDDVSRVADARQCARKLRRNKSPWSNAMADLLQGAIAMRENAAVAAGFFAKADTGFSALKMELCAAAARRSQGLAIGGGVGAELIADADAWMQSEGVTDPERMTRIYVPR